MRVPQSAFFSLLLITLLAVLVPMLLSRLHVVRLPIVVGEILAGIIIGQSGFNLVQRTPTLDFLAEFGFTFLMFLSGLEVSFGTLSHSLRDGKKRLRASGPIPLALLNFALTLLLATAIGFFLQRFGMTRNALLMGLILSTTSLGIVVPILKERGLNATPYGQLLLVSSLLSDFATLLLLSLLIGIISHGFGVEILLFLVLLAAFVAAARLGQWAKRIPGLLRMIDELSHATGQLRVRGAFALMVILVALAQALGVELILGAFVAGAITSLLGGDDKSPLREKLDAIGYGFFVPIFFISVGAKFDLGALLSSRNALLLVPILIAAAYVVKFLPALVFLPANGWRKSFAAGALLSSRLSLIIAASAIALGLELVSPATNSAIILLAIVTCTLSPIIFNRILPIQGGAVRRGGVLILGTDQLAMLLGQRLKQAGEEVVFLGRDQEQLSDLSKIGMRSVLGDASDPELLRKAKITEARGLIAVTGSPELNLAVCRLAREEFNVPVIIARAEDPATIAALTRLEVKVVQPAMAVALALEGALHFPSAFGMMMKREDNVTMVDIPLRNEELAGRPLRRIKLARNALVVGVHRDGEVLVPRGETVLELRDILVVVGNPEALRETRRQLDAGRA
ncbi:MAG TPA: monovalent cation:proton antiporter family protein [Chthoniobacterales bacterium]|nr:monovalent cation:proton antiporter family protein [Chthoniobacterales bacterium]